MADWSDEELDAAVQAYLEMLRWEVTKTPYSKRQVYRNLSSRFARTESAFEYRMQNISAVLDELGRPWIPGLKPKINVGAKTKPRIVALLTAKKSDPSKLKVIPEYKSKLPAMRDWLIEVARGGGSVTYGEVMAAFGIGHRNLHRALDYLGHQSEGLAEPVLTALVVDPEGGACSEGFSKEFGITDDAGERLRLYLYWKEADVHAVAEPGAPEASLEVRAARFVSVEARPMQAAFRRAVFLACGGRCVISGCDIVRALDAAHKHGRNWRRGHNRGEDGYVLRKDLHALYDSGLLWINKQGFVEVNPSIIDHYGEFVGVAVK